MGRVVGRLPARRKPNNQVMRRSELKRLVSVPLLKWIRRTASSLTALAPLQTAVDRVDRQEKPVYRVLDSSVD